MRPALQLLSLLGNSRSLRHCTRDARCLAAFLHTAFQQGKTLLPAMPGQLPREAEASMSAGMPPDELLGHLNRQLWLLCLLWAKVSGQARAASKTAEPKKHIFGLELGRFHLAECASTQQLLSVTLRRPRRVRTRPLCPGHGCPELKDPTPCSSLTQKLQSTCAF